MVRHSYRGGIAALILLAAANTVHASEIAKILDVVNAAYRTPPGGAEQPAKASDLLIQDEAIRTESDATLNLAFIDGSQMSLEPDSDLVLSQYVFDPQGNASAGLINLQGGAFHFTSQGAADKNVVLQTPVATIGIRGTEIAITIGADGATRVDVLEGAIELKPSGTGKSALGQAGQSVSVTGPNENAEVADIGDVATAAGLPAAPPSPKSSKSDDDKDGQASSRDKSPSGGGATGGSGGSSGGGDSGGGDSGGGDSGGGDSGGGDSGGGGSTNHSGQGDGSNPGQGGEHSHNGNGGGGGSGGSDNPGGGKN